MTLTESDSLSLSDSVLIALGNPQSRAGGDNILLSDSLGILVEYQPKFSDQLSLTDSLKIQRSIALSLADSLSLSDVGAAPVLAVQILLVLSDSLSLSDTFLAVPSDALDLYLRRYLNDVS